MSNAGHDNSGGDGGAARIILLNRWLRAVAALLGADSACVIASEGGIARIIARHNIPHAFLANSDTSADAPYATDGELLLRDASARPEIHAFLGSLAGPVTGFFYRRTLGKDAARTIALVAFGASPRPDLDDREVALAREVADRMAEEVARHFPSGSGALSASAGLDLAGLLRWLELTDLPAALLDGDLRLKAANERMKRLLPANWSALEGKPVEDLHFPAAGSLARLFRHALETGVSTPCIDLAFAEAPAGANTLPMRVVGAPVTVRDAGSMLVATIDPASAATASERLLPPPRPQEATAEFLFKTLVLRRALRSRHDVSYVTLRSWRQPIREHQISALKALKRHAPESVSGEIAAEIADDVRSLFGGSGFTAVVPMPCGHSTPGRCLSAAIAQGVGAALGLPVAHALALPVEKGGSHPRTNAKRGAMRLLTPVAGPVLLVDDVATSGRHMEEATRLLRATGASVLAVAWIGGDAGTDD